MLTVLGFLLGLWGAGLSTVLGAVSLADRRRQRHKRVDLVCGTIYRPLPHGGHEARLYFEATNLGEQTVSLKHWFLEDVQGTRLAGSPYEGRVEGPDLLQPRQLHGWTLEPEQLKWVTPPVTAVVELTTGEQFRIGPIGW